jgi:arylsulfatase A-like enzyme
MLCPLLLALAAYSPADPPPRLVVLISVDQLIPEQLDRLEPVLDGGLGRLWREGAVYRAAALQHAATETGPGHATLATGCHPRTHGVTGNMFHDRVRGVATYCVEDRSVEGVPAGAYGGQVSPINLRVPTLADHMRTRFAETRVFSVAGKNRSAVCMGGREDSTAVWWDSKVGGFVSSTWYGDALPLFVSSWNEGWLEATAGFEWTPCFDQDPRAWGTEADFRPGETPFHGQGTTFPYEFPALTGDRARSARALGPMVYQSPLVDRYAVQLARAAVGALDLGQDDVPDLLSIGLSGCDVVGHMFGPYSWEVTDLVLRADDELGLLFKELDGAVGEGRWVAALAADHGVLELPESLARRGGGARRVTREERSAMAKGVASALGARWPESTPRAKPWGHGFVLGDAGTADPADVRALVAQAATEAEYVAAAYTLEQLSSAPEQGEDPYLPIFRMGFDPERSEDVVLRYQPWWLATMAKGTTHGSPYPYDRRIPLAFLGTEFSQGRSFEEASSADVAPTLLGVLGIEVDGLDGRDLRGGR